MEFEITAPNGRHFKVRVYETPHTVTGGMAYLFEVTEWANGHPTHIEPVCGDDIADIDHMSAESAFAAACRLVFREAPVVIPQPNGDPDGTRTAELIDSLFGDDPESEL